ncbi:MAG: DUF6599 family protein [Bacteroidales bacterium]
MRTILFFLLLLPLMLAAQPTVPVSPEKFPDAIVGAAVFYNLESLPEYNEGADLFMEAGFQSLMVQEITWEKAKLKVEVYQMNTPEAAFGVYSLSIVKCLHRDTLVSADCSSLYQYQAAYGNLYISLTSESGTATARALYLPVANAVMQKNPRAEFNLPEPFTLPLLEKGRKSLVYIQGPVGLQDCPFPWQELFLAVRFGMYAISLPNPDFEIYFARIRFETPADMLRFLTLAGLTQNGVPVPNTNTNDGLYREYQQLDDLNIYFLQSQEPWPISAVINPRK